MLRPKARHVQLHQARLCVLRGREGPVARRRRGGNDRVLEDRKPRHRGHSVLGACPRGCLPKLALAAFGKRDQRRGAHAANFVAQNVAVRGADDQRLRPQVYAVHRRRVRSRACHCTPVRASLRRSGCDATRGSPSVVVRSSRSFYITRDPADGPTHSKQ
eukprot:scaffold2058_cov115-Isochrysis_galbana.AAC.10